MISSNACAKLAQWKVSHSLCWAGIESLFCPEIGLTPFAWVQSEQNLKLQHNFQYYLKWIPLSKMLECTGELMGSERVAWPSNSRLDATEDDKDDAQMLPSELLPCSWSAFLVLWMSARTNALRPWLLLSLSLELSRSAFIRLPKDRWYVFERTARLHERLRGTYPLSSRPLFHFALSPCFSGD
jgi:hypothetical protein